MTQKNSFISLLEQIAQLNKNSIEIITKMNDVVASNKSSVTVNYQDIDGRVSKYEMPSVGWLKNEIDIANSNIKKLSTLEGDNSVIILDENTSRKIKSVDLSREPAQITNLNLVTSFKQSNNWFFEGLINPSLSVEIDLVNQIKSNVNKVLSRRYIIKFDRDADGNLTTNGQDSLTYFENNFLNKNNFSITEFLAWINSPTNLGVLNKDDENLYKDEQFFDLNYKVVNYKGYFSVLKMEKDSINNKLWYHVNTLTYYDRNGGSKTLSIGDILAITSNKSYTKYKIVEVNTSSSLFRLSLERVEGYDPIPVGNNVLEYYSTLESQTKVQITIGFDEYNVMFLKPINTDNNIIGGDWSKGMSFYSNDLVLNTDNNVNMADFYLGKVYDYGVLLKDLVSKKIPSSFGTKPNAPTLITDNFRVVQINKHLTDTKDFKTLKKLHSQKNAIKSKLSEIDSSITQKSQELNTKVFKSIAEKSRSQNELNKLIKRQESETKLFSSYVSQITNSRVEEKAEPKFRIRGFWDIPDAIVTSKTAPQEVIGFEVQYLYSSKLGAENTTEGFEMKRTTSLGTPTSKPKIGYQSGWIPYKTDIRKRTFDETTHKWIWEIEDISDADTPNINQLDIAIQSSERVQIKIRSISEVGYPETPLYSDWSEIITIEFPNELNSVLGENSFILKEATQEEMRVSFENELTSKGLSKHVSESFYSNEQYYGHTDKNIATSFKDSFGNTLSLFDYLKSMNDKISSLEEAIRRSKGELKVTLYKGTQETVISNGSTINILINCEDYMLTSGTTSSVKNFANNIYLINDFYLDFSNIATENSLALLTNKKLSDFPVLIPTSLSNSNKPSIISNDGKLYNQSDNQFLWFFNSATIDGVTKDLYGGSGTTTGYNEILTTHYKNISGLLSTQLLDTQTTNIWYNSVSTKPFGATIHPYIINDQSTNTNSLVDKNNENVHNIESQNSVKVPLQIYFKPDVSKTEGLYIGVTTSTSPEFLYKALKFRLEPESSNRPFDFTLIFKMLRHKQYALTGGVTI